MTMQIQQSPVSDDSLRVEMTNLASTSADSHGKAEAEQPAEDLYRAGAYSMLAALLRQPPAQDVLNVVTGLADCVEEKDDFAVAMSMLGLAARAATPAELDDEFHALFIGIGRGELVPYGSWYMTGFLMEKPLGVLRDDLASMGFARTESTSEPEDHVAALCEVMTLLINQGRSPGEQTRFFNAHMSSWVGRFFTDLAGARSAVFYRAVARFGKAYFDFEKQYLAMRI
jgi:TorA maturation chaperone TorD